MPGINNKAISRKVLPILYVIDTSASMAHEKITAVNNAMRETANVLKKVAAKNTRADIRIGALTFDSEVTWVTNGLEELEDFIWNDVGAVGLTKLGKALDELKKKMSRHQIFDSDAGSMLPIIIFMSDGAPNDDYKRALNEINAENLWFKNSTKIAIAIGEKADRDVLAEVTGDVETVISVNELDSLESLIVVLSETAGKIGSVSIIQSINPKDVVDEALKKMDDEKVKVRDEDTSRPPSDTNTKTVPKWPGETPVITGGDDDDDDESEYD